MDMPVKFDQKREKSKCSFQGCGAVTFLVGSGSGSGSREAFRLRLRLRLRVKLFGGSGSAVRLPGSFDSRKMLLYILLKMVIPRPAGGWGKGPPVFSQIAPEELGISL